MLRLRGQLDIEGGVGSVLYGRARAFAGLAVQLGHRSDKGSALQRRGHVVLLLRAPDAGAVEVTGSFTDWQPAPMQRRPGGFWELAIDVPAGDYEYIYLVDGEGEVPPEATTQRPDGFGGNNGVLIVR